MSAAHDWDERIREAWLVETGKNPDDGFNDAEPLEPLEPIMVYCCENCHNLEPAGQRTDDIIVCQECSIGIMWLMNQADL
jgi:DNA-directed RNA polymerase subunit RPC12/RpoP